MDRLPGSGGSSHPPSAAQLPICHVFFISLSSSGSPAHDQISPSISCYLAEDGPPDQNHSIPSPLLHWLLRPEEAQATDPGFEPQQTLQSSSTKKKARLPFKVAGLASVYKYMGYK